MSFFNNQQRKIRKIISKAKTISNNTPLDQRFMLDGRLGPVPTSIYYDTKFLEYGKPTTDQTKKYEDDIDPEFGKNINNTPKEGLASSLHKYDIKPFAKNGAQRKKPFFNSELKTIDKLNEKKKKKFLEENNINIPHVNKQIKNTNSKNYPIIENKQVSQGCFCKSWWPF